MISYINRLDKITNHSISIKYIHIPTNVFDKCIMFNNFNFDIGMCALHETQLYRNHL